MDFRKIAIQIIIGAILFTIILVILEKDSSADVWHEKGINGLFFALCYGVFLIAKERFFKK